MQITVTDTKVLQTKSPRAKFYLIKNAPSSLKEELKPLSLKECHALLAKHYGRK